MTEMHVLTWVMFSGAIRFLHHPHRCSILSSFSVIAHAVNTLGAEDKEFQVGFRVGFKV